MKFIFEIKLKPGHTEEEYKAAWKRGGSIIQKEPGAQGTKLYNKIGESGKLIAIATWESKAVRDAAMEHLKYVNAETTDILEKHKEYGEINILGYFEEPPLSVDPESNKDDDNVY